MWSCPRTTNLFLIDIKNSQVYSWIQKKREFWDGPLRYNSFTDFLKHILHSLSPPPFSSLQISFLRLKISREIEFSWILPGSTALPLPLSGLRWVTVFGLFLRVLNPLVIAAILASGAPISGASGGELLPLLIPCWKQCPCMQEHPIWRPGAVWPLLPEEGRDEREWGLQGNRQLVVSAPCCSRGPVVSGGRIRDAFVASRKVLGE